MSSDHINILAIEASGMAASVALVDQSGIQAMVTRTDRHGHAAWITDMVDDLIQKAEIDFPAITHIAAGAGPGSFTGIRVGLAAAQGYGIALAKPVLGISSLDALGFSAFQEITDEHVQILALIDTRRGHYFAQIFDWSLTQHSRQANPDSDVFDMDADMLADHITKHHKITPFDGLYIRGYEAEDIRQRLMAAGLPVTAAKNSDVDAGMIGQFAYTSIKAGMDDRDFPPTPRYHSAPLLGPAKTGR